MISPVVIRVIDGFTEHAEQIDSWKIQAMDSWKYFQITFPYSIFPLTGVFRLNEYIYAISLPLILKILTRMVDFFLQ